MEYYTHGGNDSSFKIISILIFKKGLLFCFSFYGNFYKGEFVIYQHTEYQYAVPFILFSEFLACLYKCTGRAIVLALA